MEQEELSHAIDDIFEKRRLPYEGVSEARAKGDLLTLITKSNIELLTKVKRNVEYNENGQNKVINFTIRRLREQLKESI